MNVRAIFFDLGGVILRTEYQAPRENLAGRLNMTYEDLCRVVFDSESSRLASIGAITTEQHWATVAARLGWQISDANSLREEFFAGDVIDRDLVNSIRALRPRYRTAILSNGWPDVRSYILRHRFDDAFDALVISAEIGVMKPDRRFFEMALDQFQLAPHEAVLIDDMPTNVEAARTLGMHGIVFQHAQQSLDELIPFLK